MFNFSCNRTEKKGSCQKQNAAETAHEDLVIRLGYVHRKAPEDAKEKIDKTDEQRASYYYEHTGKTWGDVNDYHMILDTWIMEGVLLLAPKNSLPG